jgi:hypothetical protein
MWAVIYCSAVLFETADIPAFFISTRGSEGLEEYRPTEKIEFEDGFATLGAQGVGLVQDCCDSALLR